MLSLESSRWEELRHAYGPALDTPSLLSQLRSLPEAVGESEPWFTLWSSLAHQGDVFPASFAAVPHVVSALASQPENASFTYFHFPAWVEICRQRHGMTVPTELEEAYYSALSQLPGLAATAASRPWDENMVASVLAAIAAAKGNVKVAEAALELSPDVAATFLEWLADQ